MLVYVESPIFPHRTFTVSVQPLQTVARIRAQLLHILYELGKDDVQFRLRYKGEYLRDAYTIDDYSLMENALLKLLPTSREKEDNLSDLRSLSSEVSLKDLHDVTDPLCKEVEHFRLREHIIRDFRVLTRIHFLGIIFVLFTSYWYAFSWMAFLWLMSVFLCPMYTRTGGYIGKQSVFRWHFCIAWGTLSLGAIGVSIYLATVIWLEVVDHGCKNWEFVDGCSVNNVYSGAYFSIETIFLLVSNILIWVLVSNMRLEVGDLIEEFLVQSRDIEDVMKAARKGRAKDRRIAAFELATLATSSDDNKFRIVAEGGLDVLMRMALSTDETTQEHSVEAIAELLTIPSIQDTFVEMGGVRTLTALLHSPDPRLVYEAAVALSYIVSDSEYNKTAIMQDHGLEDLCYAANRSTIACQRVLAGIFLDLAFHPEVRAQMASLNSPAKALLEMCKSNDSETQRFSLQTLELLAIESSDMICAQEELLTLLLDLPMQTLDERIYLLAGKIMLYFAENRHTCEAMLDHRHVKESLTHFAHTRDPILQKVVVKVIFCALEYTELKLKALHLGLDRVLMEVREDAADREAWDMADQAHQAMMSEDEFDGLPQLSTVEKLSRMDPGSQARLLKQGQRSRRGSQGSTSSSIEKISGSLAESISDLKKGIN